MDRNIIGATSLQWKQLFRKFDEDKEIYPNFWYTLKDGNKVFINYESNCRAEEGLGVITVSFDDGTKIEKQKEIIKELKEAFSEGLVLSREMIIFFMKRLEPKLKQVLEKINKKRYNSKIIDYTKYVKSLRKEILRYLKYYENNLKARRYMPRRLEKYEKCLKKLRRDLRLKNN